MKTLTQPRYGPAEHGRRLTLEKFESARWESGYKYELIRGRLYVSPVPEMPHFALQRWLFYILDHYSTTAPDVFNLVAQGARLFVQDEPEETCPEPDIVAFRDAPTPLYAPTLRWQDQTPVLAVEVVSPGDPQKDYRRNVGLYLKIPSIREYWILDPKEFGPPTLTVYRRRGNRWQKPIVVGPGKIYETPRFMPGFSLLNDPLAK